MRFTHVLNVQGRGLVFFDKSIIFTLQRIILLSNNRTKERRQMGKGRVTQVTAESKTTFGTRRPLI